MGRIKRSPMDSGRPSFGTAKGWLAAFALGGLLWAVTQASSCEARQRQERQPAPTSTTSR